MLLTAVTYATSALSNATTYAYVVRAVIIGAGGDGVESVAALRVALSPPTAPPGRADSRTSVTSGGNVWTSRICSITAGDALPQRSRAA